jgi:probable F420-dependent oxidoreductase
MHIDGRLVYKSLREVPEIARAAEGLGFDGLWTQETDHEPFLGAALAAEHTTRLTIGTSIALAFTRSPTELAYLTWDLAQLSGGRFVLGLGTQVKAHITRRFGMPWDAPAPKLREVIGAIRAVWASWSEQRPLDFRGRYFSLSLMTPFFTPPGPPPRLHIETAGVGARMCRLAGEVADGFHVHPFHTRRYLREVVAPAIEAGLARRGRARGDFVINAHVFVATGAAEEVARYKEEIRRAVAFYGSTPSYRPLLDFHGWTDVGQELSRRAARGQWSAMSTLVTDEMLGHFALWGPPDEVAGRLHAEYGGLADRLSTYDAIAPGQRTEVWRALLGGLRAAG